MARVCSLSMVGITMPLVHSQAAPVKAMSWFNKPPVRLIQIWHKISPCYRIYFNIFGKFSLCDFVLGIDTIDRVAKFVRGTINIAFVDCNATNINIPGMGVGLCSALKWIS